MAPEIRLAEEVSQLLALISKGWAAPEKIQAERALHFTWGTLVFSKGANRVEAVDDRLIITLQGDAARELARVLRGDEADSLHDKPIFGSLERGFEFSARFGVKASWSYSTSSGETLVLNGFRWELKAPEKKTRYYIGRLKCSLGGSENGNLIIHNEIRDGGIVRASSSAGNYRFIGRNTYYIIKTYWNNSTSYYLLIDNNGDGETPHHDRFHEDLLGLQFALGKQAYIDRLYGIETDGSISSYLGSGFGTKHPAKSIEPPVPSEFSSPCWSAFLFEKTSKALYSLSNLKEGILVTLDWYVRSLGNHIDDSYLRLYTGIKALSYWITHSSGIGKIANSPNEIIKSTFADKKIELTDAMNQELDLLYLAELRGTMKIGEKYVLKRELKRVALVRTFLVALICKTVGYDGEINGWETDQVNRPILPPSSWWQVEPSTQMEVAVHYVADLREELANRIFIIVEGPSDAFIVRQFLKSAKLPIEQFCIYVANGPENLQAFANGLPNNISQKTIVIIDQDEASIPDAQIEAKKSITNPAIHLVCAVPEIEAWLFADHEALVNHIGENPSMRSMIDRLPPPEEIPAPRQLANYLFGKSWASWDFIPTINIDKAMSRSPSLRNFIQAAGELLGVPLDMAVNSLARSISRDLISSLISEIMPNDTIVLRTADGYSVTAERMKSEIEGGTDLGMQYASDLLRVARDFLTSAASPDDSNEGDM